MQGIVARTDCGDLVNIRHILRGFDHG